MKLNFLSSAKFNLLTSAERRPSAQLMAERLRAKGVTLDDSLVASVAGSPTRLNALHQLDFAGQLTAFEHLERLADHKTLLDGAPSAPMVSDLFSLAGDATYATGKCYSRTNHSVYSAHHMGEMARILTDLASTGRVTLASGVELKWDPAQLPVSGSESPITWPGLAQRAVKYNHTNTLWAGLNQILIHKDIPNGGVLTTEANSAYRGQMANVTSRLMGEQFVNVNGAEARPHLTDITFEYGPMLAEYGAHGGSVYDVTEGSRTGTLSWEAGRTQPVEYNNLGYVVVPASAAEKHGLTPLSYADDDTNYVNAAAERAAVTGEPKSK